MPDKFAGDRKSTRGFINQLELVFTLNPRRYSTDAIKIATICILASGQALAWFNPYLERPEKYADDLSCATNAPTGYVSLSDSFSSFNSI
jgi:hypothetical protein